MQVLRSRYFPWCALIVMGVVISSVGCRSTRNSISTLPGMSWMGSQGEASFSSMASGEEKPMLPPPSREATPQVVTGDEPSKALPATGSYPDTGFPSPIGPRNAPATSAQSDVAGSESLGGTTRGSSAVNPSSVGATQRGFYGEQYQEDRPSSVAGGDSQYEPPTGTFDAPSSSSRESVTSSPTRSWGSPAPGSGLSAGGSPYQQIRDGLRDDWQNTTSAVSRSAEQVTQQAEEFVQGTSEEVRQGVDSIRDGVRGQYQEFTQGVAGQVESAPQDTADRSQDYSPAAEEARPTQSGTAVSSWGSSNPTVRNETSSQSAYSSTSAPNLPGYGAAATLNPPGTERRGGRQALMDTRTIPQGSVRMSPGDQVARATISRRPLLRTVPPAEWAEGRTLSPSPTIAGTQTPSQRPRTGGPPRASDSRPPIGNRGVMGDRLPAHDHVRLDHLPGRGKVRPRFLHVQANRMHLIPGRFGQAVPCQGARVELIVDS